MTKKTKFLNGQTIRPDQITTNGIVSFTDGTNNGLLGNQESCEAYGYTYDKSTGYCRAFINQNKVFTDFSRATVSENGVQNTIRQNVQNSNITGNKNTISGYNNNINILGNEHEVGRNFDNASILGGTRGTITRESEIAIGGGKRSISDSTNAVTFSSKRKTSTLELSCVTIDNTATNMTIQGDGSSFINVENNSIIGYDIYITRLELGGSSGTAGNYSYRNIRGAVKINQVGVMSFVVGFSRNIAKVGVNGTCIMADSTTGGVPSISVNVQDRNNVQNLWSASVTLHEVISETLIV
ncbi:MAG: hypothetical protein Unbinned4026contig1003_22 [Prokaryotic dsDNA virus sp.]|nr:MAG: hypothetical protein Unbinned4026contig1003_22 [Prokaryotic dsDNA virus sp.]|tara:strand:- start:15980 stop:16870 length:891 start_codon:yes stop_codon:yes gene_type:complete